MTKITYPEPGLVKSESSHIASVKSTLNSLSGHSFDIPDGISDSVLETFPTIVEGFITTLNDLEENMQKTDANYKKLKGYKVRTVVWIDHYTLGTPYTHAREDSDKYKFDVHPVSKEKVKKNNYIVIVATVGRKSFGYIGLNDAEIVGKGSYAKNPLAKIDNKESANAPDIDGYIRKIDQLKKKKEAEASRAEEKRSENGFAPIANGASGDSVVEIQEKLIALGFLASSADGAFGPGTEQAVKDFQNANHLKATGIVNEETYNAIRNAEVHRKQKTWDSHHVENA